MIYHRKIEIEVTVKKNWS